MTMKPSFSSLTTYQGLDTKGDVIFVDSDESASCLEIESHQQPTAPPSTASTSFRILKVSAVVSLACLLLTAIIQLSINGSSSKNDDSLNNTNMDSRMEALSRIVEQISSVQELSDPLSPQYKALDWLAHDDPAMIDPTNTSILMERYSLAALFFSSGGNQWRKSYNFLSGDSVCEWNDREWEGVTCDNESVVEQINMYANNLHGTLPHELVGLSNLKRLDIQSMSFQGQIPIAYGSMTSLVYFSLPNNTLTGTIPSELGALSKLGWIGTLGKRHDGNDSLSDWWSALPHESLLFSESPAIRKDSNRAWFRLGLRSCTPRSHSTIRELGPNLLQQAPASVSPTRKLCWSRLRDHMYVLYRLLRQTRRLSFS